MSICVWVCRPLGISSEHQIAGLPCFNHCEFPTNWQVGHHPQVSKQLLFWWFQPLWEIWNSESQLGWLFPTEKKCSKPPSNYYKFPALIHELLSLTSWFYSWFNHGQVWQETLEKSHRLSGSDSPLAIPFTPKAGPLALVTFTPSSKPGVF